MRPSSTVPALRAAVLGALSLVLAVGTTTGLAAAPAQAAPGEVGALDGEEVSSPDGSISATVGVVDGRLTYEVVRDGATSVVSPSGLGFTLSDPDVDLTEDMEITGVERDTHDETWTPAWGTDSSVQNQYEELVVSAVHTPTDTELDVSVRVFDDGFGLRYTFPQQEELGKFNVTAEDTQFGLSSDLTAYYLRAGTDQAADERHYQTVPIAEVPDAQTPITFSRDDGLFMSLHEAALVDYPSMTVERGDGPEGQLVSELIALPNGIKAVLDVSEEDFSTPWRTITVGRDAGDLAESHMIANLNPPCTICDVDSDDDGTADTADWIDPGTYTGVWWELQRRDTTWNAGPNHGATTERTKEYIDLADEAGAKYVLAEGWNVNAGGSWTNQDFLTPMDDFDIDEVLAYAESKDVGFVAHNETRGYVDYYDENIEEIFAQYQEWGIHAIKTGYATRFDLGGTGRSHYDQEAVRHYQRVMEVAAEHEININAHEAIKPTGLHRTYPNMMTGEGVAGMEQQNYKGASGNPPEQASILPFTRWMGGAADYTPGVLDVLWDPGNLNTRVQSTTAHQLALYTTFWSPLQMLADTPENYAAQDTAFEYLKDIPSTWDESHVLDAEIGDHVATARRSGEDWYLGTITDENDRTVDVPLDFLEPDTTYVADVFADAADASWKGNPTAVTRTRSIVESGDTLSASMVGAGGQAVRFTEATPEQVEELPELGAGQLSLAGEPTATYEPLEREVTIEAEVTNEGASVASSYLYLDGTRIDSARVRLDGGESTTLSATVPVGSFPYAPRTDVGLGDGSAVPDETVGVALLPFPDQSMVERVGELEESEDLSGDIASRIRQLLEGAIDRAGNGDLTGVELAMQSIRLRLLGAAPAEVSSDALEELDGIAARWLGEPYGLMDVLARVRAAQDDGTITEDQASDWREKSVTAVRAAIREDDEGLEAALEALAESLADVEGEVAETLRATVSQQQSADALLEAEDGERSGGAEVDDEHPGFTGSGFARTFNAVDACVAVATTEVPSGPYLVTTRFANGMTVAPLDRQLTMTVGDRSSKVQFPNQGQGSDRWRRWADTDPYPFTVGDDDPLKLCYDEEDTGNVNVDSFTLAPDPGVIPESAGIGVPTIAMTLDPATPDGSDGWWTSPVDVTATAGDVEGAEPELRIDGGAWEDADEPLRLTEDGRYRVAARAVAGDQVSATTEQEVQIDGTAPESSTTVDAGERTVTIEAEDATSGVAQVQVRTAGEGDFETYDEPVSVPDVGATLEFRAVDRAGNVEEVDTVTVRAATTTVAEAPESVQQGQAAQVDVTVSGPDPQEDEPTSRAPGDTPTGEVEVLEAGTVLARGELQDGAASIEVEGLDVGERTLTVRYVGSDDFAPSADTVGLRVVAVDGGGDGGGPGDGGDDGGGDDGGEGAGSPGGDDAAGESDAADGGWLPSTGGPAAWLLALAALMVGVGLALRRRRSLDG
ncbi:glycoside hydrolase family 97 catalytic domain-containing protein [Aeromicrobium sp. CF4.19]|uniref:glycoside hydrolase family 97 catalytic domain-containing protein n=1 Tax=Aeromicrobium sp. CF4.19 TaxID=3373082 RepID=UPI003EE7A8BC